MNTVRIRISEELYNELKKEAEEQELTVQELIADMIKFYRLG